MRKVFLATLLAMAGTLPQRAERLWVEAEAFTEKGGWVVDQQFMDEMGSPYLLAHGLGVPVADAETTLRLPVKGTYYVFVRTFNWTSASSGCLSMARRQRASRWVPTEGNGCGRKQVA